MNGFPGARRGGLGQRLIVGSFWNLVAMSFNQGTTLIVNILLARILGKAIFGEYAIVQNTLLTAATFAELSLGFTAMKHLATARASDLERTGRLVVLFNRISISLGVLAAVLVVVLAPWISGTLLKADYLSLMLVLGAPFLLFQTINGFQIGALNGLESFRALSRAGIVAGVGSILLVCAGGYYGGREGAMIGLSAAGFVRWLAHRIALSSSLKRLEIPLSAKGLSTETKLLITFTLPAALAAYVTVFSTWFGNTWLVRQDNGFSMMGIYAAANNLRFLVMFVPIVIGRVGFSMLSHQVGLGERSGYKRIFRMNMLMMVGATALAAGFLMLLRKPVLHLFGSEFISGAPVLMILLASTLFEVTRNGFVQHLQSNEWIWSFFLAVTLPRDLLFIFAVLWAVPRYGAEGLAGVYLMTRTLEMLLAAAQVRRLGSSPVMKEAAG